jgi:hypothetical protein
MQLVSKDGAGRYTFPTEHLPIETLVFFGSIARLGSHLPQIDGLGGGHPVIAKWSPIAKESEQGG